ncbi:MAG TPA: hypothetical protein VN911_18520 [Candidatus Acidoferrum sp.]|nr:hypothetical protein [Candidatus Acidoferrum sp.]
MSHKNDSYQATPSGVPLTPQSEGAFRRSNSDTPLTDAPLLASFARSGMFQLLLAIAFLFLAVSSPFLARAQNPAPSKPTADLPPGAMQAKATTACTECHEARIILQQRLTKAAWTKEVDKMTKWGAVVDAADRDALIDYLSTNFSPDKSPYEPSKTATEKTGSGKSSK